MSTTERTTRPSYPSGTKKDVVERMLRVNHAGEYGATRIYAGQLRVLKNDPCADEIKHMGEQEQEHLAFFDDILPKRGVRPSLLHPFWHIGGYVLGAGTALLGKEAAMACTVAVEEVIDEHYREQLDYLKDEGEDELVETIERFRQEELEHRDTGLAHNAEQAPFHTVLSGAVRCISKTAIEIAKRI